MTLDCALTWPSYKQETLRRPQNKERGTALPWGLFLAGWAFLFAVTLFVICMEAADALGRLDGEENLLPPPPPLLEDPVAVPPPCLSLQCLPDSILGA